MAARSLSCADIPIAARPSLATRGGTHLETAPSERHATAAPAPARGTAAIRPAFDRGGDDQRDVEEDRPVPGKCASDRGGTARRKWAPSQRSVEQQDEHDGHGENS